MRSLRILLPLLLAGRAYANLSSVTALSVLPDCASNCLNTTSVTSTCPAADLVCLCTNTNFQDALTVCTFLSCTVKEQLTTKNATLTACGATPRDDHEAYQNQTTPVLVIAGIFFVIRFVHRFFILHSYPTADDYMLIATSAIALATTFLNRYGVSANGLGRDVWTVPFDDLYDFGMYFYITAILYYVDLGLAKVTILMFFLRIFPTKGVRRIFIGTAVFCTVWGLLCALLTVFQCKPISYYWTSWDGEHTGTCLSARTIAWVNAAVNIAVDVWMLAVPLVQLYGLQLHWKKKLGVGIMFCVGTFVTVVSILRLQSIIVFGSSTNATHDNLSIDKWSTVELCAAIICICLPSARLFLVHFFPRFMGSTKANTNNSYPLQNSAYAKAKTRFHLQPGNVRLGSVSDNAADSNGPGRDFGTHPNTTTTVTISTARVSDEVQPNPGNVPVPPPNARHIFRHTSYTVRSSTENLNQPALPRQVAAAGPAYLQGIDSDSSSSQENLNRVKRHA